MNPTKLTVSVIIPCRNEENYIKQCIDSIINGTAQHISLEIIVVDGMSTDNTLHVLSQIKQLHESVIVFNNPKKQTQFGLNLGIKNATGEYVMIAGAHSSFPKGYIETLLKKIQELQADGAGGQLKTEVLHKTHRSNAISQILAHPLGVGNSMFRIGATQPIQVDTVPFGLYKRSVFEEAGYYNEKLTRNHDMEWSKRVQRAGKIIFLIPELQCTYFARETYSALARNNFRNGLWNILAVCITRTFKSLSLRHFVPFGFVGALFVLFFSGIFYLPLLIAGSSVFVLYFLAVLFVSVQIGRKGTTIFHVIWGFMVLHFSYGIGSIVGVFRGIGHLFVKSNYL